MNHIRFFRPLSAAAVAILVLAMFPAIAMGAAADHFTLTGPAAVTDGFAHSYTVTAMDTGGLVDTTYTGTVTLTDGATPIGSHPFILGDAGVYTFTGITLTVAGAHTLTASDASITDGTLAVDVRAAGIATHLVVTLNPTSKVDVWQDVTVTAKDDNGTTDEGYTAFLSLTTTDPNAVVTGMHSFTWTDLGTFTMANAIRFLTAGSWTVSAPDSSVPQLTGTSAPVDVAKGDQVITWVSGAIATADVGQQFQANAGASSGLPASVTIDPASSAVCSVNGTGLVSFSAAGNCRVLGDQAGDANWNPATQIQMDITIKNAQTITYDTSAPGSGKIGDTYTPAAHATSTQAVTFTIDASSATVCTIAAGVVHMNALGTCRVNANQAGDANWWPASQLQQSFGVGIGTTTTTLGTSLTPSTYGDNVTFTATIAYGGVLPIGTVQFKNGGVNLGTPVTLDGSAQATISTTALTATTHTITAVYSGDTNYAGSTSLDLSQVVNPAALSITASSTSVAHGASAPAITAGYVGLQNSEIAPATPPICSIPTYTTTSPVGHYATSCLGAVDSNYTITTFDGDLNVTQASSTTTLGTSGSPTTYLGSVTFTATVTGAGAALGGTVQFKDGLTDLGTAVSVDGSGVATLTSSTLLVADHSITAVYSGDTNHATSTSTVVHQIVNGGATTTTTLGTSLTPSTYGDNVTFTATIAYGGVLPIGTVQFKNGGVNLGTPVTLDGSAQATISTTALTATTHTITAVYSGDTNYAGSTSLDLSQVVNPAALSITASSTSVAHGASAPAITAGYVGLQNSEIAPATPPICSIPTYTTTSPVGHYATSCLGAVDSNYTITTFDGDLNVTQASSTTTLGTSGSPSTYGGNVTFTATVTSGGLVPTGTVQFKNGGVDLGSPVTLDVSAQATISTTALAAATHTITAVYSGDTNHATSTSLDLSQVVDQAPTTTTLGTSGSPSAFGNSVTFTATVSGAGTTPTGTVQFQDGGVDLGSAQSLSGGVALLVTSSLSAADHSITAIYSGDVNNITSTSNTVHQVVAIGGATATVALGTSGTPSVYGDSVTFTATVSGGAGTATGTVQFKRGGSTDIGTPVTLSGGTASVSTSALTGALSGADHSITAVYSGDGNYAPATSPVVHQIVDQRTLTITAEGAGMTYHGAVPTINALYTGLQNSELAPATPPTCSTNATITSPVGSGYTTSCSGAVDPNYDIHYVDGVFNVTKGTPVLEFTSAAPSASPGGPTYTPTVSTPSDVDPSDVAITVDAASSTVCTITAGVVSFDSVGTCTLNADEPSSANWNAAIRVQQNVIVSLSVPTQITVSAPATATAGTPISVTVTVKDVDGNPVTSYTGTVHLTSTDGVAVLPIDYQFTGADSGTHTFATDVTLKTAATQTITATDVATPSINGTSDSIAVSPAEASKFLVTLGTGPVIPGATVSVTVRAQDAYNNTATGYTGTVHLTTSDAAGNVAANYAFTGADAGSHTFAPGAILNTPSTPGAPATQPTVTATDTVTGSITGTSGTIYCGYPGSVYTAIQPSRVLDTRPTDTKNGVFNMGLSGQFVVGTPRTFQVANAPYVAGGSAVAVPAAAIAVTGNLTITSQLASSGTISLGPKVAAAASGLDPTTEPTSINFIAYENRANNVTVGLSARGTLDAVYRGTAGKRMDLVFDVTGYFMAGLTGNRLTTVSPGRVLDTRPTGQGIIHMDPMMSGVQPFRQQQVRNVKVVGAPGTGWSGPMVPANATAVTANVTVTMATTNGYVSFGPTMVWNPKTSTTNVNKINARDVYAPDTANGITVALNGSGNLQAVWIGGSNSSANVILDITGYFTQDGAGMAYYPIIPTRMMNSGYGGTPIRGGVQLFSSSEPQTVTLGGVGQIPSDAGGISGNVTLLTPSTAGFVYVGPSPIVWASTSTVNGTVGRGVANGFDVKLSVASNGRIGVTWCGVPQIHSNVAHVSVDVTGYFK